VTLLEIISAIKSEIVR